MDLPNPGIEPGSPWKDSLEKEMVTHSSTFALKIPWTEELGAGYYPWGRKESGTSERLRKNVPKVLLYCFILIFSSLFVL